VKAAIKAYERRPDISFFAHRCEAIRTGSVMTKKKKLHNFAARCDGSAATCPDFADVERWRQVAADHRELAERPMPSCVVRMPLRAGGPVQIGFLQLGMMS
jgi:hypothetical protein